MVEYIGISIALCLVALFIYIQVRRTHLPPKAQLVCDLWEMTEKSAAPQSHADSSRISEEASSFA